MTRVDAARGAAAAALHGLPRALLAASPEVIRNLARRAEAAAAVAGRRRQRAGERPVLDATAADRAESAYAIVTAARRAADGAEEWSTRVVTLANAAGVGWLLGGVALVMGGIDPMSVSVSTTVVAGATASLAGFAVAAGYRAQAQERLADAVDRWARALHHAGVPTMGALAARRLAVAGWERLAAEAEAAERAASHQREAWERVSGLDVDPKEVEHVLATVERARQAHLALFAALLDQRATERLLALGSESGGREEATVHYLEPTTTERVAVDETGRQDAVEAAPEPGAEHQAHDALDALIAATAPGAVGVVERTRGRVLRFWRVG